MSIHAVVTTDAPMPLGPYSQAVWCADLLFISGQLPLDPNNGSIAGAAIGDQTRRTLRNLLAILASQGLTAQSLVKTTVFLRDMAHFPAFNTVYEDALGTARPARSVVAAAGLPKNVLVEIEAVACR
ncbi:MAG: regulator [Chitinispirillaceae bacterium]|nr:regulator [Chitinispirillaceae bacterium]